MFVYCQLQLKVALELVLREGYHLYDSGTIERILGMKESDECEAIQVSGGGFRERRMMLVALLR